MQICLCTVQVVFPCVCGLVYQDCSLFVCSLKSPKPSAAHLELSFTAFSWFQGSRLINIFYLAKRTNSVIVFA